MAKQHSNLERSALGRNQSRSRPEKYKHIRKELKINNKFCPGYPLADYIDKWVKVLVYYLIEICIKFIIKLIE